MNQFENNVEMLFSNTKNNGFLDNYENQMVEMSLQIDEYPQFAEVSLEVSGRIKVFAKRPIPNKIIIELKGLYILEAVKESSYQDHFKYKNQSLNATDVHLSSIVSQRKNQTSLNHQFFLQFALEVSQLNQQGVAVTNLQISQTPYQFPFKFLLPNRMPPSISGQQFIFGGVKINTIYMITVGNISFDHSWNIDIINIQNNKSLYPASSTRRKSQLIKITKQYELISKTQLSNVVVFSLYKYCFCRIAQYNLELTTTIPTPFTIQIKVLVYNKGRLLMNQQNNLPIITQLKVNLFGELVGLNKKRILQKKLNLNKGEMSGYESQTVLQLQDLKLPKSYNNQLFVMRYWLEVQFQSVNGIRMKIVQTITKDIQL